MGLSIYVDDDKRTVSFEKDHKFTFTYDQLTVENNLTIYQKNKMGRPTPWSNYSYLRISTFDNKDFYISSIVMTIDDFPISAQATKYSFWPSINKWYIDRQPEIERIQQLRTKELNEWKEKFSSLTKEELKLRLEKPKVYDELPRKALQELLKKKN